MNDAVEALLTEEGRRWRGTLGPDPDLAEFLARPRRRGHVLPVVLAAAVVVVAVALVGALTGGRPSGGTAASRTSPCQDDFTVSPTRFRPAAVGPRVAVRLSYRGTADCVIAGLGPYVEVVGASGDVLGTGHEMFLLRRTDVTVRPGDHVSLSLTFVGLCPTKKEKITALRLHLDGHPGTGTAGVTVHVPAITPPVCPPGAGAGYRAILWFGYPKVS